MQKRLQISLLIAALMILGCKDGRKYHDTAQAENQESKSEVIQDILNFQQELNEEFRNPDTSPLPDRYRKDFEGLSFFKPDSNFRVEARFVRTPEAVPFLMPTTTGRKSKEVVYGLASFSLNGAVFELEVYQNQELMLQEEYRDYLFLPFLDNTNGEETYGGGRYIDLSIPEGDTLIIDFNKSYNPYCAYNKKYSCPIVPRVNYLNTEVTAGVKAFKK